MERFVAVLSRAAGYLASGVGLGIVAFTLLALLDPQGAQMANDSNPFGQPPSNAKLLKHLAVGLALVPIGAWLVARGRRA
jgi:hypothetical protein